MLDQHHRPRCVSIYRSETRNVGDQMSTPSRYFDMGEVIHADIETLPETDGPKQMYSSDNLILGGGGLFIWKDRLRILFEDPYRRDRGGKLFVWGAGANDHDRIVDRLPSWTGLADLVGVRDIDQDFDWVPCASCMSPAFDTPRQTSNEIVIYDHHDHPVPLELSGVPRKTNFDFSKILDALDFLGSADLVLTSTYHGVYWSVLLGKRVVAWPFSSRFHYMKHPPAFAERDAWLASSREARQYPEALEECRNANRAMYEKVMDQVG